MSDNLILYRPVGVKELDLIKESGWKAFPPRLSWQPIFYPVLDYEYACKIANDWNTNDEGSGYAGFVTKFELKTGYMSQFEVKNVGASNHNELWIPAEQLAEFNSNIEGEIEIIKAFYGSRFTGNKIDYEQRT